MLRSDTLLLRDLRRQGHRFYLEPAARIAHLNVSRLSSWLVERFLAGRAFAALRARPWSRARRLAYAAAAPLIPLVRAHRILRTCAAPVSRSSTARAPALVVGLVVSAAGGLRARPRHRAPDRLYEMELKRSATSGGSGARLMPEPFCSIIVPTYRRPPRLAQCLEALARLDYPRERFEVIVVDDGGGAPLDHVVAPYRDRLDVTLLTRPHAGPAAARNAGAARARGELLVFTDDDCRPAPTWLRHLAERFAAAPDRAFGGRTINALSDNPYSSTAQLIIDVGYAHNNPDPDAARFFTPNNLAVPADGFRSIGGFDPAFFTSEDRDLCDRWVWHGLRMSYVPDAVVHHAHPLDFAGFWRRQFSFGRGAACFHRAAARRWRRGVRPEGSYYVALLRHPFAHERPGRALVTSGLLLVWWLAYTAGFCRERWSARRTLASVWPLHT
jgi:GT2 family glycosyltransferase